MMNNQLLKKYHSRYRKHLENNTLNLFWLELSRRDFRNQDVKEKTKKISYLKRHLHEYDRQLTFRREERNRIHLQDLSYMLSHISLSDNDHESSVDYEDYDDSFYQDKFIDLKNRLLIYNNDLEFELELMREYGNSKNIWPYNSLTAYINILQSLNDRIELLKSFVNPFLGGRYDKIFLNLRERSSEPDMIGLEFNQYGFYDKVLFKVLPYQLFDPSLIEQWCNQYGFSCKIVIIDLNLVQKSVSTVFELWTRSELVQICVDGELCHGFDFEYYLFDGSEYQELINSYKIDLEFQMDSLKLSN